MKTTLAFCIALIGYVSVCAQNTPTPPSSDNDKVFTIVQQRPIFPGDINKWLADNIVYPKDAQTNNIQGTVYVNFIVEKDGSVSGVKVLRGVQGGNSLNDEALRVVSIMPKWQPGMQNGHTVRVQYMVPIHFVLSNTNPQKKN